MPDKQSKLAQRTKNAELFQKGKMDLTFFFLVLIILTVGLVMLFSASAPYASTYYKDSYHFITRQLIFAIGGLPLMLIISKINYHVLKKLAWPVFIVTILLLVTVLIIPETVPGFKRWVAVGPLTFQPSEIAKFSIILLFSYLISKNYREMKTLKYGVVYFGALLAVVCGLVIAERHLSGTLLIFMIGIVLMFVGGVKWKYIILGGLTGAFGGAIAIVTGLIGYGSDRIKFWIDPWADPLGLGYQTIQSLLAIGSGGLMGQGIGESSQKYLWVPEPQNDFIFSIVCEEVGFFGALFIIIAFVLLVWRGFIIAMRAPDKFGSLLVIGLIFQVGLQTVFNMLVVTNTIPNTGISLPFFSYGGTALLMLMAEMGVVLSVSRQCNMKKV